jgi:hypothetical protein
MKSHSFQWFQRFERLEQFERLELNYTRATLCRISASGHG